MAGDYFGFRPSPTEWRAVAVGTAPPSCFSDEIAIDFPSVDQLVPRVRDRFFGHAEVGTLAIRLPVSRRAAARGTPVLLDVPLRGTCDRCGGRGETWSEVCRACDGSGHTVVPHAVRVWVPAGVTDGTRLAVRVSAPRTVPVQVEVLIEVGPSLA
mgnify:CR=1 FL=1